MYCCLLSCWKVAIIILYSFSCPYVAPPLTVANVMAVVGNVRNWKTLAEQLVRTEDDLNQYVDLDYLQHRHSSDEDCLKEVVDFFLLRGGLYYRHRPSWRFVLWCLVLAREAQLALCFKEFSEQLEGTCMCLLMVSFNYTI